MRNDYNPLKLVKVKAYRRFRYGKWENVCEHYRSYPHR